MGRRVTRVDKNFAYQLFYSGTDLEYLCRHTNAQATDADPWWEITKFTYTAGNLTEMKTLFGSVTGRAALAW